MQELIEHLPPALFLLKDWLPVGLAALVFFGIGLLLAKFVWGRYNQRLANAVDENMALAGQWSALGASQQDLFKKLRVRWQADREAYGSVIAEKDSHISRLVGELRGAGVEVPPFAVLPLDELEARARVRELEARLAEERSEVERLRGELERPAPLPFAVVENGGAVPEADVSGGETLEARIRDLEQDLIDTHDQLHGVRAEYEKQVALVESLEAKLIARPGPTEESAQSDAERAQLRALLDQRGRELRRLREGWDASRLALTEDLRSERETSAALRSELEEANRRLEETREAERSGLESLASAASEERSRLETRIAELENRLAEREAKFGEREAEVARLEEVLSQRAASLSEAEAKLSDLEAELRRKGALRAELNDACHELYDVRRALLGRIETIGALEARLAELENVEAKNLDLSVGLDSVREELAMALEAGVRAEETAESATAELASAKADLAASEELGEALSAQLNELRREASELRLSLAARSEEHQRSLAQMDELEAIISDRGAEVNDLSAELRQQRDLGRQLKEALAQTQGELEALGEEAARLDREIKARTSFAEEQERRVEALEGALAARYRELDEVRIEAEDRGREIRHFASRATQLEDEMARRSAVFVESDRRIISVEGELEVANARIAEFAAQLDETGRLLADVRTELESVAREKEEKLRELERATRRVAELEETTRLREVQMVELERSIADARAEAGSLQAKAERLAEQVADTETRNEAALGALAELEAAARQRDEERAAAERELAEAASQIASLMERVDGLQAELEEACEERRRSEETAADLRESLRAGDERILELSATIEGKESEANALAAEIATLESEVQAKSAAETEALARISALEEELSAKQGEIAALESAIEAKSAAEAEWRARISQLEDELAARRADRAELEVELETVLKARADAEAKLRERLSELEEGLSAKLAEIGTGKATLEEELALRISEADALQGRLDDSTALLRAERVERSALAKETEGLRRALAERIGEINELHVRIGEAMMQNAFRDAEIEKLRQRLQPVEAKLETVAELVDGADPADEGEKATVPASVEDLCCGHSPYEAIVPALLEEAISLDEIAVPAAHHGPSKETEAAEAREAAGLDEDHTIFFGESAATLGRSELEKIDRCAKAIRRLERRVEVTVVGYSGAEGGTDFVETLSARRADAVRERLVERGVALAAVKVKASGRDRRFSDKRARRVEMVLSPVAAAEAVN